MSNKALLVGINRYPTAPLMGCVNDVSMQADLLVTKYRFAESSTRLLIDERATRDAILERLQWLVSDLRAGDRCLFHYSGHGTQVATRDFQGEVDGLDEAICPVDFSWTNQVVITDKDFVSIFSKIPDGVRFNWTSDSCHSGDLTRDISSAKIKVPRRIPAPLDVAWRIRTAKKMKLQKPRAFVQDELDVGFVSGCKSTQTSSDTMVGTTNCGAFTYFFCQAMKKSNKKTPLVDVVAKVSKELKSNGYSQEPQVEGARAKKPFLG